MNCQIAVAMRNLVQDCCFAGEGAFKPLLSTLSLSRFGALWHSVPDVVSRSLLYGTNNIQLTTDSSESESWQSLIAQNTPYRHKARNLDLNGLQHY